MAIRWGRKPQPEPQPEPAWPRPAGWTDAEIRRLETSLDRCARRQQIGVMGQRQTVEDVRVESFLGAAVRVRPDGDSLEFESLLEGLAALRRCLAGGKA